MATWNRPGLLGLLPLLAAGCVIPVGGGMTTGAASVPHPVRHSAPPARVLLVPAEVQLGELTAGGLVEPRADWTEEARKHVAAALEEQLARRSIALIPHATSTPGSARERELARFEKLVAAVARTIILHHYDTGNRLPTKEGRFEWTVGPGAARLREGNEADYALLVMLRDSYSSAGRAALSVFSALLSPLTGRVVGGGDQVGFACLLDLKTGDVLWCNLLHRSTGDLRAAGPARAAVELLLRGWPL